MGARSGDLRTAPSASISQGCDQGRLTRDDGAETSHIALAKPREQFVCVRGGHQLRVIPYTAGGEKSANYTLFLLMNRAIGVC